MVFLIKITLKDLINGAMNTKKYASLLRVGLALPTQPKV